MNKLLHVPSMSFNKNNLAYFNCQSISATDTVRLGSGEKQKQLLKGYNYPILETISIWY